MQQDKQYQYSVEDIGDAIYDDLIDNGQGLENFPLYSSNHFYNEAVAHVGLYAYNDQEIFLEARQVYPEIKKRDFVLKSWLELTYFPAATYDAETQMFDLLFPVRGSEKYLICTLPVQDVQQLIEDHVRLNADHPWHALGHHMIADARRANVKLCATFTAMTGLAIHDPVADDYKNAWLAYQQCQFADNKKTLAEKCFYHCLNSDELAEGTFGATQLPLLTYLQHAYDLRN
jgi:hypothetical protein